AEEMTGAYTDEKAVSHARICAFMTVSLITALICMLLFLPLCIKRMDYLFTLKWYILYSFVYILPGVWITIALSCGLYNISRNVSVSLLVVLLLTISQFSPLCENDLFLRWSMPCIFEVSDCYGSVSVIRFLCYSRIALLLFSLAFYLLSVKFIRKYRMGALKSFVFNLKKPLAFIPALMSLGAAVLLIVFEPFVDHSPVVPYDDNWYEAPYQGICKNCVADVRFNTLMGTLKGELNIDLTDVAERELLFEIRSGIGVKSVTLNGEKLDHSIEYYSEDNNNINLGVKKLIVKNPDRKTGRLTIVYGGYPAISNSVYRKSGYTFCDSVAREYIKLDDVSVSPQAPGLGSDKEPVVHINVPADHSPTSWGKALKKTAENADGSICWECREYVPIIESGVNNTDKAGDDTDFLYATKYEKIVRDNKLDESIRDVMSYCDEHYGKLKFAGEEAGIRIQQISNDYGGGGAGNGYVYMGENFLSPETLADDNKGGNKNETFMHEIIHLYWGDMGCFVSDDGLWSSEGLDVYTTYRIVKEKYGELYAKKYYVDKWTEEVKHQNRNFYFRHPEYIDILPESYQATIMDSVGSINRYSRMPLMLLKAEEKLGGEEAMDEVLRQLYENGSFNEWDGSEGQTMQDFLDIAGLTKEEIEIDQDI
ncbi:MAG: hypothetical protein J6X66_00895, partial [Lachnospiraceae bacterium]|nr:hypothetical protein [Lachnospiraceae bacterium]